MDLLHEIFVVLAVAAGVVFFFQKIRIPSIVGFLIAGIAAGPSGLKIIADPEDVEVLSEIGILLLLFSIGLEFSLKQLFSIRKAVVVGGTVQVLLTAAAGFACGEIAGRPLNESVLIGILVALSSTAVILKILQQRSEVDTPQGRTTLGILIFQDLLVVPAMLIVPFLGGASDSGGDPWYLLLGKVVLVLGAVLLGARFLVPFILLQIARTRSTELFLLSVLIIGFSIAWMAGSLGLSLALGAFLAGLVISESAYGHQAFGSILPFRDVFLSFFFVSAGMLLDVKFLLGHAPLVLSLTAGVLLLKALLGAIAGKFVGHPTRVAMLVGAAIACESEFSFVLAKAGLGYRVIPVTTYQTFLAVAILSMAFAPLFYAFAPAAMRFAAGSFRRRKEATGPARAVPGAPGNHLLIVGFGLNGRNLSRAAMRTGIPHSIIEMNPDTVRREQAKGVPIGYGDATNEAVLEQAGVKEARVAVVAINDPVATRRIVEAIRRLNPGLHLIARTRFLSELKPLTALGADEVVPEEFETAVEIFSRVMKRYLLSRDEIDRFVAEIRAEGYEMLRSAAPVESALDGIRPLLSEMDVSVLRAEVGSAVAGKSLESLELRRRHGVSVLAISRDGSHSLSPVASDVIAAGDRVIVIGRREHVAKAAALFRV